jgi:soluble lytic murein transglycosylase-like protein
MWLLLSFAPALALTPDAARAMAMGNCALAVAGATGTTSADALVRAECALRGDDPGRAVAELSPWPTGPLGPYARLVAAEARLELEDPAAAIEALDGVSLPGRAGLEARLLRGRARVAAGRSLDARDDLRLLLECGVPTIADEARFLLATGAVDRGDVAAASATFTRLWVISVIGPWSDRAAEALAALGAPVPDLGTAPGRTLALERAGALADASRSAEAHALRLAVAARDPSAVGPKTMIRSQASARDYAGAIAGWAQLLGAPSVATGSAKDLFDAALSTARTGDYDTAAVIYRRLLAQHPTDALAVTADYKLGYMAFDRGDDANAIALLRAHADAYPSGKHIDEALWFAARASWRSGDVAGAVSLWKRLQASGSTSDLVPGAAYWLARSSGDPAAERAALSALIDRYPTSGYAWLAAERVGRTFPRVSAVARPPWPPSLATDPDINQLDALVAAGFPSWAVDLAPAVAKRAASAGREGALAGAHALIAAGAYKAGVALARPYCVSPWKAGDPVAQQACTPAPERATVAAVAARHGLDPLLPYAIMQAESGLDPSVTSPAGARGLMQLMPAEGPRIHAVLSQTFSGGSDWAFDADDLYLAPYNAGMGATELGMKHESLGATLTPVGRDAAHTSLPAVIASYNGGEAAVRRWLEAWPDPPPADAFAEDISFTETRQYVRRVLGHLMAYRWTYGDG